MNMYAIVDTDNGQTITRIEAHDITDAQCIAKRYGDQCTAVIARTPAAFVGYTTQGNAS